MAFLNSIWLWSGLAAAGVATPIIIHLLNRFRHRNVDWGAMELLRRALIVRSRQVRIEDLIILILRCLAMLLIALALSRPTLRGNASQWMPGGRQLGVVIAIDGSYSMGQRGVNSAFDLAKRRTLDVLSTLEPGDPVSLVLMGRTPRILLRNVGYDQQRFNQLLDETEFLPERLDLDRNLESIGTLVREMKAPVRECYFISDAQALTWEGLGDPTRRSIQTLARSANLFYLNAAAPGTENLGIRRFEVASGSPRQGTTARYVAEVRNYGRFEQQGASVTVSLDGEAIDRRTIGRLAPGQAVAVPLFVRFEQSGVARLTASIGADALNTDNTRYAVSYVPAQIRVLVVDGEPSDRPFASETDYLVTALTPKRATAEGSALQISRIHWLELSGQSIVDYDVVVLANVADLRADQVRSLAGFVETGGGLLIFLGDKVEPGLFNNRMKLNDQGDSLCPATLGGQLEATGDQEAGFTFTATGSGHRLARMLNLLPEDLVQQARVRKLFTLTPTAGATGLWQLRQPDVPLLVAHEKGRGKVILCATTADRAWTDLPAHPVFPMMLHEAITELTAPVYEDAFTVGQTLALPLPGRVSEASVTFISPSGETFNVKSTKRAGQAMAEFDSTGRPGFYEMRTTAHPSGVAVAVNVDAAESDIRSLRGEAMVQALSGLPIRIMPEGNALAASIRESRVGLELWRPLLLAGLIVLLIEMFLARRFTRRAARREQVDQDSLLGGGRAVLSA